MLTLLRKIRKSFIESGAATKYILYATGEILLVMVGILLALQVNNWNEERLSRKNEKAVLSRLIKDLNWDYEKQTWIDNMYADQLEDLVFFKSLMDKSELTKEEVSSVMPYWGASILDLNPRTTSYQEMVNTGKLYDLTNETLVEQIINYYKITDQHIYLLRQARNEFRSFFYSVEFNDYWILPGNADKSEQLQLAMEIMNNKGSRINKLMTQAANWSVTVIVSAQKANKELIQENRRLLKSVSSEISEDQ